MVSVILRLVRKFSASEPFNFHFSAWFLWSCSSLYLWKYLYEEQKSLFRRNSGWRQLFLRIFTAESSCKKLLCVQWRQEEAGRLTTGIFKLSCVGLGLGVPCWPWGAGCFRSILWLYPLGQESGTLEQKLFPGGCFFFFQGHISLTGHQNEEARKIWALELGQALELEVFCVAFNQELFLSRLDMIKKSRKRPKSNCKYTWLWDFLYCSVL